MVQLNTMVMIPVTRADAISEHPFAAALARTLSRNTGFLKWRRFFFWLKRNNPATAVTEYPRPVAVAAPLIPMWKQAIKR